jgi:lipopolysaccharide transport system permease protein
MSVAARSTVVPRSSRSSRTFEPTSHYLNPVVAARDLWRHRALIRQFTRREVEGRYRGSLLGVFWSFLNPMALLFIYTFVFGIVFQARWPDARTRGLLEYAVVLFGGITVFGVFSECVSRAAGVVVAVPNYVRKVVFPLEVLPVTVLGSALFHALVSLGILFTAELIHSGRLQPTVLLFPLVLVPLIFLTAGVTFFLASLGVFVRDVGYAVPLAVQVLFFATPVLYPLQKVPEPFRTFVRLNPLTSIVENFRRVVFRGTLPDWGELAAWTALTAAMAVAGYAWFMKTKKGFADVI